MIKKYKVSRLQKSKETKNKIFGMREHSDMR